MARRSKRLWGRLSPNRDKRRKIFLLRGTLLAAVGGLIVNADAGVAGLGALALVLVFAASNVALLFAPLRIVGNVRFDLAIGAIDLLLVGLGIHLAGADAGFLPVTCLLMVLVVAMGYYRSHTIAGAVAVGALHAWLVLDARSSIEAARQLGLQVLFLCSIGLQYGFLVQGLHRARRREEAEHLERRELLTLVRILEAITSSLDVRKVTLSIVTHINSVVPAVRCSLLYIDANRERCFVLASHDDPNMDMLELDLRKYPEIRRAMETRQPVIVPDVSTDPLMAEVRSVLAHLDFHSIMVLPLTFGEELLGTLLLKTARAGQEFTRSEIHFCNAVARASANALKNAVLHRQVQDEVARHRSTGEKLQNLLHNSPDLILTTDTEGRITEFNQGAEELLGHTKKELLGRCCSMLLDDPSDAALLDQVLDGGTQANRATLMRTKDGRRLSTELTLSTLRNGNDETIGTAWIGRDVTELKSAQMQLVQAEKLSTIGNVISGVAHELNNPLSVVLGFSQLLMAHREAGPDGRQLAKINDAAMRCQKIVQNLLSFARVHKPERRYLGANGIIEKTLDLKTYQLQVNNIEIVKELDPELPCTMLDFHQMQQVLLNLINNAQHAMVAVHERPGRLIVRTSHRDGEICIEITDNGEGMDAATLERIFEPFFTTQEQGKGTGLGLSVSYGIVKEHGGRIHAESRKGRGTTFVVRLPIRHEKDEQVPIEANQSVSLAAPPGHSGRVLVVDDEPMIVDLLIDILRDLGHGIDTAANGQEAWKKASENAYDLVITDVRMPGMNGIELYRKLLAQRPEMKNHVIFITGDLIDSDTANFLAQVEARAIAKPLEVAQVIEAVTELMGGATTDAPG
jgi:PAS domain S-box-containing protein